MCDCFYEVVPWRAHAHPQSKPSPEQIERHRCHICMVSLLSECESESSGWPVGWTGRHTRCNDTVSHLLGQKDQDQASVWKNAREQEEDFQSAHLSRRSWFLEGCQNSSRARRSSRAWLHVDGVQPLDRLGAGFGKWCMVRLTEQTNAVCMKETI